MVSAASRPLRCVVVGGSLVGLSAGIALSGLGMDVTVFERSPARAIDGGGGLGVDVALLSTPATLCDHVTVRARRL
jgi:2-polyprenyl-6-methoxyphenol hydroxylase-like FAD-dependent oxidoreductase